MAENPRDRDVLGYPEPRYERSGLSDLASRKATRRQFIKGIIASGAAVSSAAYLFGCSSGERAVAPAGGVERMLTLRGNGAERDGDVLAAEALAMTPRFQ